MNNGISFRFNFETDDIGLAHEMMPLVLGRLRTLQELNTSYKTIELSLHKPGNQKKTACLTIHTHDSVIREESRDEEWSHAIETVFNHVEATNDHTVKMG
jgi:hypothetical protein